MQCIHCTHTFEGWGRGKHHICQPYIHIHICKLYNIQTTMTRLLSPAQSICPGMVDTDFLNVYSQAVDELPKLQPMDVAKAVLYALDTPDGVQVEDIILQKMRKVD